VNVKVQGPYIEVTLSRRNLIALLGKLDRPGEAIRTLTRMAGDEGERYVLTVIAEEDEQHYGERTPGYMGADLEEQIAADRARREEELRQQAIAQQHAKIDLYADLKKKGEPIPEDLRREVEEALPSSSDDD